MKLSVSPIASIALFLALLGSIDAQDPASMTAMHLAAGDSGRRIFLQSSPNGELLLAPQPRGIESAWYIVPVAQDMVRI